MKNVDKIIHAIENERDELLLRAKIVLQYIRLREELGYTQEQMANKMGVSFQLISRFERMEHSPTTSFLAKYADALGANLETILSFKYVHEIDCNLKNDIESINYIVTYNNGEISIPINFDYENETIWMTQEQIATLFDKSRSTITEHINNIYKDNEIDPNTSVGFSDGSVNHRPSKLYNLDVILAVGYRVNSKRGIEFRKWASSILKDYMYKGYSINKKRMDALNKTIEIQNRMLSSTLNIDNQELANVINEYTKALNLLDDYDHQVLPNIKGTDTVYKIDYNEARSIINKMRFNNESSVFGIEKEAGKLNGILEAVYQNVFGEEVYKSIESKAAHLLYFLVKDHPFIDGCKRIAATLFLEFLNKNHILYQNGKFTISNDALVSITLLTAESKPEEMDMIVKVIENILAMRFD